MLVDTQPHISISEWARESPPERDCSAKPPQQAWGHARQCAGALYNASLKANLCFSKSNKPDPNPARQAAPGWGGVQQEGGAAPLSTPGPPRLPGNASNPLIIRSELHSWSQICFIFNFPTAGPR